MFVSLYNKRTIAMKKVIGYTDSITECECCGKTGLKGTYCLEIDGEELYYGSTCAFKSHGITEEVQAIALGNFKKQVKANKIRVTLEEMVKDASGNGYKERKVLAFIKKQGLDLVAFVKENGRMFEETKFYFAYEYAFQSFIYNK